MSQDGSSPMPPCRTLIKDNDYFLEGEIVVIQVEDVLFRIPTHRLIKGSAYFAKLFESNGDSAGPSEHNPIRLPEDVRSKDFKCFLKLLYPKTFMSLGWEEWISVLRLATRWFLLEIRDIAITELVWLNLSPLENITLGREMKISKRLLEGYGFVESPDTISDEDAAVIGWQTTVKLFRLREEHRARRFRINNLAERIRIDLIDEFRDIDLAEESLKQLKSG